MENLAIVDLGSNSVRMAITEIADNGDFREIKRVKENTRLSEGMGTEKILQPQAIEHTIAALKRFKRLYQGLPNLQVRAIIMTGLYINVFGLRWRKAVKVRG